MGFSRSSALLLSLVLGFVGPALSQEAGDSAKLIDDYLDAWNARDAGEIVSYFAETGEYVDVTNVNNGWATPWRGHATIREAVEEMHRALPDLAFEVHLTQTWGDFAVVEWTMTGTHTGDWETLPATGREFSVPGVSVIELEDGKIRRQRDYWDGYLFMSQLGVLPGPGGD